MNLENELDRTAIHEAGHAVICWDLGIKVIKITIVPDKNGIKGSGTIDEPNINYSDISKENLELIQNMIMIKLSGYVALQKAMGSQIGEGSSSDWVDAYCMADNLFHDSEINKKILKVCEIESEKIINSRWPLVEALANELLEKKALNEQEVLQFLKKYQK